MGYRIVYGEPIESAFRRTCSNGRLRTMIAALFLLFSLVVRLTWQDGAEIMREYLLPGDLTVTELAFSEMISDLQNGDPVADAVTVFCRTILNEAS